MNDKTFIIAAIKVIQKYIHAIRDKSTEESIYESLKEFDFFVGYLLSIVEEADEK